MQTNNGRVALLLLTAAATGACTGDTIDTAAAADADEGVPSLCDAAADLFSLPADASESDAAALVERLYAAAPAEVDDALGTVLDTVAGGDVAAYADPGYLAADASVTDAVLESCDRPAVEVEANDYAFVGLPDELAPGRTVFELSNTSTTELHELSLLRKNDDTDLSFDELFELPDEQASAMVSPYGTTIVGPDARTVLVTDLEPGDYLVACFLPVDSLAPSPESPPHLVRGMYQVVTVTG